MVEAKESSIPNPVTIIGRRVEYNGAIGTVRYYGPLKHNTDKAKPGENWIGVEWDDPERGRHNGTVEGVEYFKCRDNLNAGSLLKADKVNYGQNIYNGLLQRYFKDPVSAKDSKDTKETKDETKENVEVDARGNSIEVDEDIYVQTAKKFKKKIEFLGFNKVWKKINDLKHLLELALFSAHISDVGPEDTLSKIVPVLENLSLEDNLLYDWNQIYLIGRELKNLKQLSISGNILKEPENVVEQQTIYVNSTDEILKEPPIDVFMGLQSIILINMGLTWKTITKVLPAFRFVEELILCKNDLRDFDNLVIREGDLTNLKFLNMEETSLTDFSGLLKFSHLPKLENLTLNKNHLKSFGKITGFSEVKIILVEYNEIEELLPLSELNQFPKLDMLRCGHNPVYNYYQALHIRQRAIAEIKGLKRVNGSELRKYERKDCEIYYMRNTFDEYFKYSGQNPYEYDYEAFLKYCDGRHPRVPELIQIYGNPYEPEKMKEEKKVADSGPKKSKMISVSLSAFSGPALGKPPAKKKFSDNTLVVNLKPVLSKMFGISQDSILLRLKIDPHQPFTDMTEDLKDFLYYGVRDGSEIWVGDASEV